MIRIISRAALGILFTLLLTACSSKEFSITGNLKNLGTQNLRMVYISEGSIKSVWLPVMDGHFNFKGNSPDITVVEIFNRQMDLLARVAIENGESADVEGDINKPYDIKVTSSDLNVAWSKFVNDNAKLYTSGDRWAVEKAVEKFVRENPDNELSPFLVAYNYANAANLPAAKKLLDLIPEGNKPEIINERLGCLTDDDNMTVAQSKIVTSFILYSDADTIEAFNPSNGKISLLYFWSTTNPARKGINQQLKMLRRTYTGNKLQIADITLESDSSIWKREIRNDSTTWKHYWGLGGKMNDAIKKMGVTSAPYFLVIDSIGTPLYRGVSLDQACATVDGKLKK